jgi:hypothetical protein
MKGLRRLDWRTACDRVACAGTLAGVDVRARLTVACTGVREEGVAARWRGSPVWEGAMATRLSLQEHEEGCAVHQESNHGATPSRAAQPALRLPDASRAAQAGPYHEYLS